MITTTRTTADLRFLVLDKIPDQQQAIEILARMGTRDEVITWFFSTLDRERNRYAALLHQLQEIESRLPEEQLEDAPPPKTTWSIGASQ